MNIKNYYNLNILIVILFILFFSNCKNKQADEELNFEENETINNSKVNKKALTKKSSKNLITDNYKIILNLDFSRNILVNDKIILFDLTSDAVKFIKKDDSLSTETDNKKLVNEKYDSTTDLLESNNFIYSKDEIDVYLKYKEILKNNIYNDLDVYLSEIGYRDKIALYNDETSDSVIDSQNKYFINIEINELNIGEYNLIKNKPTTILVTVKLEAEQEKISSYMLFNKKYRQKANIDYPLEKLRIINLAKMISEDIIKSIKNKLF